MRTRSVVLRAGPERTPFPLELRDGAGRGARLGQGGRGRGLWGGAAAAVDAPLCGLLWAMSV